MADDLTKRRFEKNAREILARLLRLEDHIRGLNHEVARLEHLLADQLDMLDRVGANPREVVRIRREVEVVMDVFAEDNVLPAFDAGKMSLDEAAVALAVLAGFFDKKD